MSAYINPINGDVIITSKFGPRIHPVTKRPSFHNGIDIRARFTFVLATAGGIISAIRDNPENPYGYMVTIKHKYGYSSFYAHLSEFRVKLGQEVIQGDCIGVSGNSGTMTTAMHLHFGMTCFGIPVNPVNYIPLKGVK